MFTLKQLVLFVILLQASFAFANAGLKIQINECKLKNYEAFCTSQRDPKIEFKNGDGDCAIDIDMASSYFNNNKEVSCKDYASNLYGSTNGKKVADEINDGDAKPENNMSNKEISNLIMEKMIKAKRTDEGRSKQCDEFFNEKIKKSYFSDENKDIGFSGIIDQNTFGINSAPQKIETPTRCLSQDDSESYFSPKGMDLYTKDQNIEIIKLLTRKGLKHLCTSLAYESTVKDSETKCIEGLEKSKTSCVTESDKRDLCQSEAWTEYKDCIGITDESTKTNTTGRLTRNLSKALESKFGVCYAFREISRSAFEEYGEWAGLEENQSLDGVYNCGRTTPWTQDYQSCMNLLRTYNGFLAGETGRQVAQEGWTMLGSSKIKKEASESMAEGDQLEAGFNAQEKTYKMRRDQETVNLGFYGSKTGVLTSFLLDYQTPKKFSEGCSEKVEVCLATKVMEADELMKNKEMFPNQDVKKRMWEEVMKSASQATLAGIMQSQFNKMAQDTNTLKNAFKGLADESTKTNTEMELDYCKYNPNTANCKKRGPRVTVEGGFSYGGISNQGNTGGTYGVGTNDSAFGEYDDTSVSEAQQTAIDDLSNMMDNQVSDSFTDDFSAPGAGAFKNESLAGGGGGAPGVGGGAGGGGGSADGQAAAGNEKYAVTKSKGTYGIGSSAKYGSGNSLASSKSDASNPFSNMFGSSKGRSVANSVENDIAPAHSGLFDKISQRYGKVNAENRLINTENISK